MGLLTNLRGTSLRVHLLIILFGMRAWVDNVGLWVELPILVDRLPEGWALGSYFSIIFQLANIVLIIYTVANVLAPKIVTEKRSISVMYIVGFALALLLASFWDRTSVIGGVEHSTAVLTLSFFMGGFGCTTSVLFVTFVTIYKEPYVRSMFIGQGLAQLLPSLLAVVQGVGNTICQNVTSVHENNSSIHAFSNVTEFTIEPVLLPPLFSARDFFLAILGLEVVSGISFVILCLSPFCKREQVQRETTETGAQNRTQEKEQNVQKLVHKTENINGSLDLDKIPRNQPDEIGNGVQIHEQRTEKENGYLYSDKIQRKTPDEICNGLQVTTQTTAKNKADAEAKPPTLMTVTRKEFGLLLFLAGWANCVWNGVLRSFQSYAGLPYGNQTYHLSVTLGEAANPVSCFLAMFLPTKSIRKLCLITFLATVIGCYILGMAFLSPRPLLVRMTIGEILIVSAQVVVVGLINYTKVNVASICHEESRRATMWFGIAVQIGSFVGTVVAFLIINVFSLLQSASVCSVLSYESYD